MPSNLSALLLREWLIFSRSRLDIGFTLLTPLVTLFFLGAGLSNSVGTLEGVPYLHYILPGVAVISIITNTMQVASRAFGERYSAMLREILTYPVSRTEYMVAKIVFSCALSSSFSIALLGVGGMVLGVGFTVRSFGVSALLLTVLSFLIACIFITVSVSLKEFGAFLIVNSVLGEVFIWSSTIFTAYGDLPGYLRGMNEFNPVSHLLSLTRQELFGFPSPLGSWEGSVALIFGSCVLLGVVALRLFSRRIGLSI